MKEEPSRDFQKIQQPQLQPQSSAMSQAQTHTQLQAQASSATEAANTSADQIIDYAKYQTIIPINYDRLKRKLKTRLESAGVTKNFNKNFVETLYLGFMTYFKNTMDDLIKISVVENDFDFKQFSKEPDGDVRECNRSYY